MWREENWLKVHFSDENKCNLFRSDGKHFTSSNGGKTEPKVHKEVSER